MGNSVDRCHHSSLRFNNNNKRKICEPASQVSNDLPTFEITTHQRDLLLKTWSWDFESMSSVGANIYSYIFAKDETLRTLFPTLSNEQAQQELLLNKMFEKQAVRFTKTLSTAVQNVNHPHELHQPLLALGTRHWNYFPRIMKESTWDLFTEAVIEVMTAAIREQQEYVLIDADRDEAVKAWALLAQYVVNLIKIGYYRELERRQLIKQTESPRRGDKRSSSTTPPGRKQRASWHLGVPVEEYKSSRFMKKSF